MSNNFRVSNLTTGGTMKFKQAKRLVEECCLAWVIEGESVRNLTLAEQISARNEQAKRRAPIASPELPGLVYHPPVAERSYSFLANRRMLTNQAREFAAQFS